MDQLSFHIPDIFNSGGEAPLSSDLLPLPNDTITSKSGKNYNILNIYNPANQTKKELISNFVVRIKEYNEIIKSIETDKMQSSTKHYIIQGPRGSGKTTLLLRMYYEVKDSLELNKWLIPVRFDEEQYNVRTLYKLWENVALYLEDELEEGYSGLYDQMQSHIEEREYEKICYEILQKNLKKQQKKLVLFIDNFGDMLIKFQRREHQRLQDILTFDNDIRIVGGSSIVLDYKKEYVQPMYELFRIIQLEGLSQKETINLLLRLGKYYDTLSVREIMENDPGRIESLRRLTSGVPRTIVLLFEIFVDNESGDSFRDLETILDRVTPLYKHRMDDLSPQQQEIVHAVAMNWDAVGVKEIAKITRMESKAVSAQLKQLEYNRIVSKIRTNIKNHFYQINERFFNIWYLMRYGRKRDRNKVLWLVRFLENWCNKEELIDRAERHVQALRKGIMYEKHALFMTEALSRTGLPEDLQYVMIQETRRLLTVKNSDLLEELSKSDKELYNSFAHFYTEKNYSNALKNLLEIRNKTGFVLGMTGFLYELHLKDFQKAEQNYIEAINKDYTGMISNLASLYEIEFQDMKKAEKYYLLAFKTGNTSAIYRLALLYQIKFQNNKKAIQYYQLAVDKGHTDSMNSLAMLYQKELKDFPKAIQYYRMAADQDHVEAMNNLAWLFFILKKNKEEAMNLLNRAYNKSMVITNTYICAMILLWNDQFDEGVIRAKDFMENKEMITNFSMGIEPYLMLLIAKKQYTYTHTLFSENNYNIKDVYKPIYYALMYFMRDTYPDEYKRMGEELKLTVDEVISQIKQMEVDYA
jgi:TPR repeat protein/DNA-binding transcriptional regulator GbsR (MarR family)